MSTDYQSPGYLADDMSGRPGHQDRQIVESVLSSLVACHECDLLHQRLAIEVGAEAHCVRCNASLYTNKKNSIDRALAVGLAALILFVVANSFPFLQISVSGNSQSMSIISAVYALAGDSTWILAVVCFGFILLFPLFRMAGLLYILLEIYLFGAIVAFVKLTTMANIELGHSFWAFAVLNVLTVISVQMIDNHSLWELISESRERDDSQSEGVTA